MEKKVQINIENLVVGLCDDEQYVHEAVEKILKEYEKDNHINIQLIHYASAKELLEKKDKLNFLLLDIEMPEMDGIEAGKKLRECNITYKIIMLTVRTDRFREAFKIGAFRFVPKPVEKKELYEAVDEVIECMIGFQKVTVHKNNVPYEIFQKDILYIEGNKYSTVICTKNSEYRSEYSLKKWQEILDERMFFKCEKSYIVNLGKIENIQEEVIEVAYGYKVSVSRRQYKPLLEAYMKYDTRWR